jgi:hypothetical protein
MFSRLFVSLVLLATASSQIRADETILTDVVVYGSTPAGFCAAIAAAREGADVVLLEPTNHVGGVNTGGLSFSDSNQTVRSTLMGLFDEWHRRIEEDYESRGVKLPYQVNVKDQAQWTYEPHVAMRVTRQMLAEAKVEVLTEHVLHSVIKDGPRITGLATNRGRTFGAAVYIDATYEGDLMAAAGVSWTIGREGRDEYGESLAGKQYPKAKMPISGLDDEVQLLPLVTTSDAGPEAEGDKNVMTYSFRMCLTDNPENRVPWPQPDSYDPARFEVVRRHLKKGGSGVGFDLYALPGGKFDGNNSIGGQFSLGFVAACNGWSEANSEERAKMWEAHKQYTLEFYHFLTTDEAVPPATRQKFARLGLCKDEFVEHGHWPPALYVREGRRMKGQYVISQKDILSEPEKEDPICVSSFPIDSHDCQRVATDNGVVNEGTIFPVRMKGLRHGYPYHIPYRSILPKAEECENLLVPVALSCTHVAISSIRVEPTWMAIGQSSGVAAALAAEKQTPVTQLAYAELRERLLAQKQVLDLPEIPARPANATPVASIAPASLEGIVLDDSQAVLTGDWSRSTNFKPHIGPGYRHDDKSGDGSLSATLRFRVPSAGRYQVLMAYSAHETRATNVPVVIAYGDQITTISVDQTKPFPTGKHFRPIGVVDLGTDHEASISLSNEKTDGFVILDAFQLLREESPQE